MAGTKLTWKWRTPNLELLLTNVLITSYPLSYIDVHLPRSLGAEPGIIMTVVCDVLRDVPYASQPASQIGSKI